MVGSNIIDIETRGMVSSWMWFIQRSDIALRNQWSNYTNWPYDFLPYNVVTPGVDENDTYSYVKELNYELGDKAKDTITPSHDFDFNEDYNDDDVTWYHYYHYYFQS